MNKGKYIYVLFIISLLISCNNSEKTTDFTQGVITYDISYLQNDLENIETSLLPKKMTLTFNENYSMTRIEGFMGMFSISLISDFKESKDITMVKFFDNKYVHYCGKNEESSIFDYMEIEKIKSENQPVKDYLDYQAIKANVYEEGLEPYAIFYTNEIGVSNPNRNNPFRDVDGVLLEFQLQLLQLRMNLVATKIESKEVLNSEFGVSDDYSSISRESMVLILNKMLETS